MREGQEAAERAKKCEKNKSLQFVHRKVELKAGLVPPRFLTILPVCGIIKTRRTNVLFWRPKIGLQDEEGRYKHEN